MVQSSARSVDSYLREVPEERREALERLRDLCREVLDGYEECMDYKMPGYKRPGGGVEVAFASQARYISLYVLRQAVLDRHRERLGTADLGKGCVRYSAPGKIDFDLVRRMLEETTRDDGPIC